MKFLAVVLFSVMAGVLAAPRTTIIEVPESSDEEPQLLIFLDDYMENSDKYIKILLKQTAETICKRNDTDLWTPFNATMERINNLKPEELKSFTVCTILKTKITYVMEPFVKAIDGCLPNAEAGIADYAVQVVVAMFGQICDFTGEQLLELYNPCFRDIEIDKKCIKDAGKDMGDITTSGSKKSFKKEVCRGYGEVRPCFEKAIKEACPLQITQKSSMAMLDSLVQKPCSI